MTTKQLEAPGRTGSASNPMMPTAAGVVAVRDSKEPDGPVLLLTRTALRNAVNSAALLSVA